MDDSVKYTKLMPQLVVRDVVETAEFYRDILGFRILGYFLDPPVYAMVEKDSAEIHFGKADGDQINTNESVRKGLGTDLYLVVSDIDKLFAVLKEGKVNFTEEKEIVTRIYGSREFSILDCNGFKITFGD